MPFCVRNRDLCSTNSVQQSGLLQIWDWRSVEEWTGPLVTLHHLCKNQFINTYLQTWHQSAFSQCILCSLPLPANGVVLSWPWWLQSQHHFDRGKVVWTCGEKVNDIWVWCIVHACFMKSCAWGTADFCLQPQAFVSCFLIWWFWSVQFWFTRHSNWRTTGPTLSQDLWLGKLLCRHTQNMWRFNDWALWIQLAYVVHQSSQMTHLWTWVNIIHRAVQILVLHFGG